MEGNMHILADEAALFTASARRVVEIGRAAIASRGGFHLALAGGNTPRGLYLRLIQPDLATLIDWSRVHVWFGDERTVPPDHEQSNYRMAAESLLTAVPIPPEQVHRMEGELPPEQAAERYGAQLEQGLPRSQNNSAQLDLALLGLGPDGHIASLFPGTDILHRRRSVAAVYVPHLDTWRLSLTLPVLNSARHLLLLVSGQKKADVIRHLMQRCPDAAPLPVQLLQPSGELEWFLDANAARHLPREVAV